MCCNNKTWEENQVVSEIWQLADWTIMGLTDEDVSSSTYKFYKYW